MRKKKVHLKNFMLFFFAEGIFSTDHESLYRSDRKNI